MFKIIIEGEVIETVMYDDYSDVYTYASEKYFDEAFSIEKIESDIL